MSHTPGPWTDQPILETERGRSIAAETELPDGGLRSTPIAVMSPTATDPDGRYLYPLPDEQRDNARLMIAAPDLLDALTELFKHCAMIHARWGENSNQREADAAIIAARAAIAKATETEGDPA